MKKKINQFVSLFLLLAVILSTACDNTEFKKQIGDFRDAMSESRSAIEDYYVEMNQFEKDLYILRREVNPTLPLGIKYAFERPSDQPLRIDENVMYVNAPFSPDSIQARLNALKLIGLYGNRLAELAGTDSPAVFETNTAALGNNIANLAGTFTKLSGSGTDSTAAQYVAPISKLVGMVGRLFLERKRDKEIIKAVQEATPEITKITTQLKADFDEILIPQRRTGLKATISALTIYYNTERDKPTFTRKDRKSVLAEVNNAVRTYELFVASSPSEVIQSMEDANQALLAYANSGRNNEDFVQVVARIGEFRDYAQKVARAVQEIREIRRSSRNAN